MVFFAKCQNEKKKRDYPRPRARPRPEIPGHFQFDYVINAGCPCIVVIIPTEKEYSPVKNIKSVSAGSVLKREYPAMIPSFIANFVLNV
jgi:hypothetical protein